MSKISGEDPAPQRATPANARRSTATLAPMKSRPGETLRIFKGVSLMLLEVLACFTAVGVVIAIGVLIASAFDASIWDWTLGHTHEVAFAGFVVALILHAFLSNRKLQRYRPGDSPKRVVRVFLAFGRRASAIRYVEDALHHNPSSSELHALLADLRQGTKHEPGGS